MKSEKLAKAVKLLEALTEPHDGKHDWTKCRRCLALQEVSYSRGAEDLLRVALYELLEDLKKEEERG